MPSKSSSSQYSGASDAFMEALDGFISGLISLDRVRVTTTMILDENPAAAEEMQAALDSTLRDGYLDKSAYVVLSTVIELVTSEDEPTESPRQTANPPEPPRQVAEPTEPPETPVIPIASITPQGCRTETPAELQPGMTLRDRFTVLEQIGSGSMGQIFKALDLRQEESGSATPWVAIKSITAALSSPPNALVALQKEAANAQRLSHPNIIRVFDFDRDGEHVFMTMELLDGTTLAELLNEHRFRPLPGKQARAIIEGLCHGLTYAHDLGIIHADVKPGNVFVTREGITKLLDFGISLTANDRSQESGVYAHTPSYASCEVLEGSEPTAQDDVYSLACLAYRILAGRRAFDGATAIDAESEQLELKPIDNIAQNEWTALGHAMAFRRADRTTDVMSFLNEFSTPPAARALPDVAEPEEKPRSSRFAKFLRNLGLSTTLLVMIAVAAMLWPDRQAENREAAEVTNDALPAMTNGTKPAEVGPPLALRNSKKSAGEERIAAESAPQPKLKKVSAAPIRKVPKRDPMTELAKQAESSLDNGFLLKPADRSAKAYIAKMQSIDAEAREFLEARRRFTDLMMLEVMVAIADEDFDTAEQWIAETKSLGVEAATTERYEIALMKARESKTIRESDALGSIFASTTPAAILATPGYETDSIPRALPAAAHDEDADAGIPMQQQSGPLLPIETPGGAADIPEAPTVEPTPETLPLSALEFERHVQAKYPQQAADRKLSGWVELRFLVNAQGNTESIQVTDSEPKGRFERAATKAISKWRFKPIMVGGVPAERYSGVRLVFNPE
jgi:TonB family protein